MQQSISTRIVSLLYAVIFLAPRQLGLLAVSCDVRTRKLSKSTFWMVYSIICGCIFSVTYPFAITAILSKINALSESNLFVFIEITNYVAMYLFTVAIYIRIMFSSTKHMNYNNLAFSIEDECRGLCEDRREFEYMIPLIIRILYSYFGYAILNAINLNKHSDDLNTVPLVYKLLYFMPDLVMANTMIRVHTAILLQIVCCKRINQGFSECMIRIKRANYVKSPAERIGIYLSTSKTFDKITELHANLFSVTRGMEELTSNLMIFSILKAFAHLSSMVPF